MKYYSTRNSKINESFLNILFKGLARDGGLFLPSKWPLISINNLMEKTYLEVAYDVISPYIGNEISEKDLKTIIEKSYKNFDNKSVAPIKKIQNNKYILELFYGPTLAFKDYALQFLGNLFSDILKNSNKKITILGATSGDTGSAAINAFKGNDGMQVFILHPYQMVSEVQRRQMTTVKETNIHNIAVKGTFDDCQKIVKDLFLDEALRSKVSLTAVNSINWSRIIAQVVYYFWAYCQLKKESVSFIVPSGNFGNVFSARVAKHMGLPIDRLHVVTNENDILYRTINMGDMKIHKVRKTYSPSMDIQISSNFERQLFESTNKNSEEIIDIMEAFSEQGQQTLSEKIIQNLKLHYNAHSISNHETLETIQNFYEKYNYIADPHTATGLNVLEKLDDNKPLISLACAHPAKFRDAINKSIGKKFPIPKKINNIFDEEEKMTILDNDKNLIKSHILQIS